MPTPMRSRDAVVATGTSGTQRRERGQDEACRRGRCVSLLRAILGKASLVISGPGRIMYQNLPPRPEGTIFAKRSKPHNANSSPHDWRQYGELAGIEHTRTLRARRELAMNSANARIETIAQQVVDAILTVRPQAGHGALRGAHEVGTLGVWDLQVPIACVLPRA